LPLIVSPSPFRSRQIHLLQLLAPAVPLIADAAGRSGRSSISYANDGVREIFEWRGRVPACTGRGETPSARWHRSINGTSRSGASMYMPLTDRRKLPTAPGAVQAGATWIATAGPARCHQPLLLRRDSG
jgi:hypothetical protein